MMMPHLTMMPMRVIYPSNAVAPSSNPDSHSPMSPPGMENMSEPIMSSISGMLRRWKSSTKMMMMTASITPR